MSMGSSSTSVHPPWQTLWNTHKGEGDVRIQRRRVYLYQMSARGGERAAGLRPYRRIPIALLTCYLHT
ncbi:hypothetical protein LEMLEM_LOCUS9281 [Lemmus lemmus]